MFSVSLSHRQSAEGFPGRGKMFCSWRQSFYITHAEIDVSLVAVQKQILPGIGLEEGMRICVQPRTFAWLAQDLGDVFPRLFFVE